MSDPTVLVAGGGLAGLVATQHLADAGATVRCLEREPTVGGRVRTTREDGFVFDRGFQVLFTAYPAARRELDFDALDLRLFTPGACIARPGQRSILSDPFRDPKALTESVFNTEVGVRDKLRTLLMRRQLARLSEEDVFAGEDSTIREYLREEWGLSERFVDNFAAPFYGGITLDRSLSTSKRVFELTFKALSTGRIAVPSEGMQAIPRQLRNRSENAGATVETDSTVEAVDAADDGATVTVDGDSHDADAVVVATDPVNARDLTGVEAIPTEMRGCVTQYYALDTELPVGRRIVLNAADETPNQVVPQSLVAPEYAPDDRALISATFIGDREESDEALAEETREALVSWFPERKFGGFELLHTSRIPLAQFDQPPGFAETLPGVDAPDGRAYLAGDFTQWSSIQGAMASGREAARAVADDLDLGI